MTDKQYPPLPEPRFSVRSIPSMRRGKERISCVDSFDADQMRAYVDADRAQRLNLTDEQCDAVATALDLWATGRCMYELGLPIWDEEDRSHARTLIRAALNNPSRPDAGNTQE